MNDNLNWYQIGYLISWVISFIGFWIYCIAAYGFLLGVGLGWLPSAIAASLVSIFWPVIVLGIVVIAYFIFAHSK